MEKEREFQEKNIYFCFIDYTKPFTMWFTKVSKILKDLSPEKPVCGSRTVMSVRTDIEKQTVGKEI